MVGHRVGLHQGWGCARPPQTPPASLRGQLGDTLPFFPPPPQDPQGLWGGWVMLGLERWWGWGPNAFRARLRVAAHHVPERGAHGTSHGAGGVRVPTGRQISHASPGTSAGPTPAPVPPCSRGGHMVGAAWSLPSLHLGHAGQGGMVTRSPAPARQRAATVVGWHPTGTGVNRGRDRPAQRHRVGAALPAGAAVSSRARQRWRTWQELRGRAAVPAGGHRAGPWVAAAPSGFRQGDPCVPTAPVQPRLRRQS